MQDAGFPVAYVAELAYLVYSEGIIYASFQWATTRLFAVGRSNASAGAWHGRGSAAASAPDGQHVARHAGRLPAASPPGAQHAPVRAARAHHPPRAAGGFPAGAGWRDCGGKPRLGVWQRDLDP